MEIHSYMQLTVDVTLEGPEQFKAYSDRNNYPFMVRKVSYGGSGNRVGLRGWAIKTNGEQGWVERTATVSFQELPERLGLKSLLRGGYIAKLDEELRRIKEEARHS